MMPDETKPLRDPMLPRDNELIGTVLEKITVKFESSPPITTILLCFHFARLY